MPLPDIAESLCIPVLLLPAFILAASPMLQQADCWHAILHIAQGALISWLCGDCLPAVLTSWMTLKFDIP